MYAPINKKVVFICLHNPFTLQELYVIASFYIVYLSTVHSIRCHYDWVAFLVQLMAASLMLGVMVLE